MNLTYYTMKTKYFLIFLALLLSFGFSNRLSAQRCLVFRYDADGNRISRTVSANCQETREFAEEQENSASNDEIVVYPNPNNGGFKLVMPENNIQANACFEIYDVEGQYVTGGILHQIETDIDIGNEPAGVYLLRIVNGEDVILKIVVKQ